MVARFIFIVKSINMKVDDYSYSKCDDAIIYLV